MPPGAAARSPQRSDHRLRGLAGEPADRLPAPSPRTDVRSRRRRPGAFLAKTCVLLAVAAAAGWLLQAFVVQPFSVPSQAMAPSIQAGDRILVLKSGPLEGAVHRGEIVVFRPPASMACSVAGNRGGDLILRVLGLPGDTIRSAGNTVVVDGRPLRERGWFDPRSGQVGVTPIVPTTLGRNQYFLMGDNRADACDSRAFGPVLKSSIVGEGIAIVVRHGHVFFHPF